MMVANAHNLIVTIKPANQRNTLHNKHNSVQQTQNNFYAEKNNHNLQKDLDSELLQDSYLSHQLPENESFDSDEDEIIDHVKWSGTNISHYR